MPAQTTAKIVIASANRLIEFRHVCLNSSRIAEISVPAWPIPIHHTKLMIANPPAPGIVTPQIPTPFRKSQVSAIATSVATPPATVRPANQPSGVFDVSTMSAIICVTDLKLCPGAITAYSPVRGSIIGSSTGSFGSCMGDLVAILCNLRIWVDDAGRISRARPEVQVRQRLVVPFRRLLLRYRALRIVDIAKRNRRCRASLLARGHNVAVAYLAVLLVGLNLRRLDPLQAVRAFLHHAARTHRHVRIAHELQALRVI